MFNWVLNAPLITAKTWQLIWDVLISILAKMKIFEGFTGSHHNLCHHSLLEEITCQKNSENVWSTFKDLFR